MEMNGIKYEIRLAKAAPLIPYFGIRSMFSITLNNIPKNNVNVTFFVKFSDKRICWVKSIRAAPTLRQT